jgi:hypothetical protein
MYSLCVFGCHIFHFREIPAPIILRRSQIILNTFWVTIQFRLLETEIFSFFILSLEPTLASVAYSDYFTRITYTRVSYSVYYVTRFRFPFASLSCCLFLSDVFSFRLLWCCNRSVLYLSISYPVHWMMKPFSNTFGAGIFNACWLRCHH